MSVDVYIARDSDGSLFMHFSEPVTDMTGGGHWRSLPYKSMICLDGTPLAEAFESLGFSDNPVRIKIKF